MAQKKNSVVDRDLGWSEFKARLRDTNGFVVDVGFLEGGTHSVAFYAAMNEFGTATIPSRPFMRSTFDKNAQKYSDILVRRLRRAAEGKGSLRSAYIAAATEVRNDLIKAIVGWKEPPNADSTIEKKGVDNPLVDTGTMQRAIRFEVRQKVL